MNISAASGVGLSPITTIQIPPISSGAGSSSGSNVASAAQDFTNLVGQMINAVNTTDQQANTLAGQLATGQSTDIHSVMIAMAQASVTLDLATQVRNKVLDAYNQMMQLQV